MRAAGGEHVICSCSLAFFQDLDNYPTCGRIQRLSDRRFTAQCPSSQGGANEVSDWPVAEKGFFRSAH